MGPRPQPRPERPRSSCAGPPGSSVGGDEGHSRGQPRQPVCGCNARSGRCHRVVARGRACLIRHRRLARRLARPTMRTWRACGGPALPESEVGPAIRSHSPEPQWHWHGCQPSLGARARRVLGGGACFDQRPPRAADRTGATAILQTFVSLMWDSWVQYPWRRSKSSTAPPDGTADHRADQPG